MDGRLSRVRPDRAMTHIASQEERDGDVVYGDDRFKNDETLDPGLSSRTTKAVRSTATVSHAHVDLEILDGRTA